MPTIDTPAGHFQVAGVAFPNDPTNAQAIRLYRYGGSMDYDDTVFEAVRIAEARERHGVKPPMCRRFECISPAVPDPINAHLVEVCETHQRETDAELDRMEAQRDRVLGA